MKPILITIILAFILVVSGCNQAPKKQDKKAKAIYFPPGYYIIDSGIDLWADGLYLVDLHTSKTIWEPWPKESFDKLSKHNEPSHIKSTWYKVMVKGQLSNGCHFDNIITGEWFGQSSPSYNEIKDKMAVHISPQAIKTFEIYYVGKIKKWQALKNTNSFKSFCHADESSIQILIHPDGCSEIVNELYFNR